MTRPTTAARHIRETGAKRRRTFPQVAELRWPFRWGGAVDTTTRFTMALGQTMGGRVAHALGHTGLGVGASRWAAGVRNFRSAQLHPPP